MVAFTETSLPSKDSVASKLAETHFRLEGGIRQIFRIRDDAVENNGTEPIKLLEVNSTTVPSGIMPVYFGPHESAGIPFPLVIVDVTPAEFERVQLRELTLPNGWWLGEELPRPERE